MSNITELHDAVKHGDLNSIKALLDGGIREFSILHADRNLVTFEEPRVPQMNYPAAEDSDEDLS
jgi:hypothetical protein